MRFFRRQYSPPLFLVLEVMAPGAELKEYRRGYQAWPKGERQQPAGIIAQLPDKKHCAEQNDKEEKYLSPAAGDRNQFGRSAFARC